MLNFAEYMNLPLIWGGIISAVILLYVLLDGFDLGVGILFPFAPSDVCRDKMINSIAPFWDGNETWLVLGGGGLFAAFPLAYSILMPAVYIPILLMLIALIFRGVAFEFRFKADPGYRKLWDFAFHFGSLVAGFMQGIILGAIVSGIDVVNFKFVGKPFDWISGFSIATGMAVVTGYSLLGSTWMVLKSEGITQEWAYRAARYSLIYVIFFLGLISIWTAFIDEHIYERWFDWSNNWYFLSIPVVTAFIVVRLVRSLYNNEELAPFVLSICVFTVGFIGLAVSLWPYVVPHTVSWKIAAAAPESQSLMLVGTVIVLPIILTYTGYCYYVFRGKAKADSMHY